MWDTGGTLEGNKLHPKVVKNHRIDAIPNYKCPTIVPFVKLHNVNLLFVCGLTD